MRIRSALLVMALTVAAAAQTARGSWEIGPFTRPADDHPVITPNPASVFQDPIRKAPVHWEAVALGGSVVALAFCALVASLVPARRAATINPVRALRVE